MKQSTIDTYKINFYNKILDFDNKKEVQKVPDTNHQISIFLFEWSADDLTNYLLPKINDIINYTLAEFETGSNSIIVVIDPINTTFYPDEQANNFPVMPTQDFREIVIAWRDFLLQPPLNGSRV